MIGSPDLLPFTGTGGFGEDEDRDRALPEELSVPLLSPAHPWTSSARFHRDFVLVAEFSEEVGPKPVLTIPDDPAAVGPFDLNHFSVRIMSVDYQASGPGPGPGPPAPSGPRLNFSEDSKVVLGDSADDAFAYVHHLTLYDLEARGMVRPFCMAYVCSDQDKLMENFCELSAGFSQASDSLKTGNRQAFSLELQRKLQELEYKRSTLLQAGSPHREEGRTADELESVERAISTHRDLLRQVTSYPNRKLKQPDFLPYDPADSLTDPEAPPPADPGRSFSARLSSSCGADGRLKPLQELCNDYFLALMKEQLAHTERRLRGDRSALHNAHITRLLSRRLALTNFLFELWSPEAGEEEEEEGGAEAPRAADVEVSNPKTLESFFSCVEEIPIKLVAEEEAQEVTSDPDAAPIPTGSVSSNDSIEVLGTEKSYRTQQLDPRADSRETIKMADGPPRRAATDGGMTRSQAYARRANSEDSIEVLSTTESIFPEDLTAITEEDVEQQPLWNGIQGQESQHQDARQEEDQDRTADNQEKDDHHAAEPDDKTSPESSLARPPAAGSTPRRQAIRWSVPDVPVTFATSEAERRAASGAVLRLLSVDEASDCVSLGGSSEPPSPGCSQKRRRKAGLRALRFLKHNSFSQHAVFCLLSGRPLLVIGGDEILVRKCVDALRLFLPAPGPEGDAVMPCLSAPLQLTDLLSWRLIGIHRSSSNSSSSVLHSLSRYSRYLALLDLDQKTLRCPFYSGSLVGRLADPNTGISRGITYLLHLESRLTALANQALLFTLQPRASAAQGRDFLLSRGFCSSENDLRVMQFLSDLIKRHHAGRGPPVLGFSYSSLTLHKNTAAT